MEEKLMYLPIKRHLQSLGYSVKGEVKDIDVFGIKENITVAVELKTHVSLKLIYQGIERQKVADIVYIAIPLEAKKSHHESYKHFLHLLRRLELGLLIVSSDNVSVVVEPKLFNRAQSIQRTRMKKKGIEQEFFLRQNHINQGGTKGKKITYYKEKVLQIASFILENPNSSIKEIRESTKIIDTSSILQKNYYNWFKRVGRGIYQVNDKYQLEIAELLLMMMTDKIK